jgi:hypothetical protein
MIEERKMNPAPILAAQALILGLILAYIGFRNWLNHDKRRMIHRERMAAIEKGLPLPAVEQEVKRRAFNVQRFLLLAGLCWLFIGIGVFLTLSAILSPGAHPSGMAREAQPPGLIFVAVIPIGIGIAHLITYWVGDRREQRER